MDMLTGEQENKNFQTINGRSYQLENGREGNMIKMLLRAWHMENAPVYLKFIPVHGWTQ